jgi:hypothetical protein
MFGGKFKLDPPQVDPVFIDAVRVAMQEVESKFPGKDGAAKREWVRTKVMDAAKKVNLKGVPSWLEEPVRDAVIYVVIETLWATLFRAKA